MKTVPLKARARTESGSNACHHLRRAGEVPAILYGKTDDGAERENHKLAVSAYDLIHVLGQHTSIINVQFEGREAIAQIKEVQRDAFGDDILHLDMALVDVTKPIEVSTEIVIKGEPKGAKAGGRLMHDLHSLEIVGPLKSVPAEVIVRVDDLDINDSIHVSDIALPEGVTALTDGTRLVVHVLPPKGEAELEAESELSSASSGEPEVIGAKTEDDK